MRIIIIALFLALPLHADEIYKWKDAQGNVQYSSKKPNPNAKPAKLPELMRGEFQTVARGVTCEKHGGIDCNAGADQDGSVICSDGFKDGTSRFIFACNSPKLTIADISDVTPEGSFKVFVRNGSSVKAQQLVVELALDNSSKLKLQGPAEVDGYGMGEYYFMPPSPEQKPRSKPSQAAITVTCGNCG